MTRDVEELVDGYDLTDLSHRYMSSEAGTPSMIPRVAAEPRTDLPVMGTVSRNGTAARGRSEPRSE